MLSRSITAMLGLAFGKSVFLPRVFVVSGLAVSAAALSAAAVSIAAQPSPQPPASVVVADFEDDPIGGPPDGWRYYSARNRDFLPAGPQMAENERFFVVSDRDNKFVRAHTAGEAQRISLPDNSLDWRLSEHPVLRWSWRANRLPEGAREDRVNDSGGAVYVTFSKTDWLGRPLSIKYVYSTLLPKGTVVSTGPVKIVVASSGLDGIGHWVNVERNVVQDYRKVFGGDPPDEPFTITLWSDSDDTKSVAEVDFDDLTLVRSR